MSQHAQEFLKVRRVRDKALLHKNMVSAGLYNFVLRRMAGELIAPGC